MLHGDDIMMLLIFGIVAIIIPGTLTFLNIYNCLSGTPKKEKLVSTLTVIVGGFLYLALFGFRFETAGDWDVQINTMQYHYSISSKYELVPFIAFLGLIAYFVLLYVKADRLPPLISAVSISLLILMNIFQIAYAIQISNNIKDQRIFYYIYHANIMLLSARVIHLHMKQEVEIFKKRLSDNEEHQKFRYFYEKVDSISKYSIFIFIVFFFVVAIIEIIFVLLGQGLDAPIKAFTDTADWTFSKQIPPPPLEYDGHYLCTVAAGGHKNVVKPIRLGTRRNETIVVNRQLCVANAFEELIHDRAPRFHKKVRGVYDKYGYPLSRKITTPFRADLIYYLMKPLEWIFLLVLYMFDLRPEQRIARQYVYVEK